MAIGSHIIPRFYLEQFATPSNRERKYWRVWVYERGKEPHHRATSSQGYENGYFGFVRRDGSLDESLESKLAKLEDDCNDVVVAAKSDLFDWSSTAYRNKLAFYAALLFARATQRLNLTNRNWKTMQDTFAEMIKEDDYVKRLAARYGAMFNQVVEPERIRAELTRLSQEMQTPAATKNSFVEDIIDHAEIGKEILLRKPWQVWKSSTAEFITSDNPMVTFVPITKDVWHPGYGLTYPGVVVLFPLAPEVCLTMGISGAYVISVDAERVNKVNQTVTSVCDRFVYSRTRSEEIKSLVDTYAGTIKYGVNALMPVGLRMPSLREFIREKLGIRGS